MSDVKYDSHSSRAEESRRANAHSSRSAGPLETAAVAHLGIFIIAATWAFGGNADWVRVPLVWWGTLGILLCVAGILSPKRSRESRKRLLVWGSPLVAFNALVIAGALNPSFRMLRAEDGPMFIHAGGIQGLPTSVLPSETLRALWIFDAIWLSCFNLIVYVRSRGLLRLLLLVLVGNALALSIFGTLQKLSGASGLYFGHVPSPQPSFFATFIYHNHWGSFILLMLATCLGLTWYFVRRREWRDFLHSPAPGAIFAVLLMAATIPLSTSRSCTLLAGGLLGAALAHLLLVVIRARRRYHESIVVPVAGSLIAIVLAVAATWFVARESILRRTADTQKQVATMLTERSIGGRAELYADTWKMAQAKLLFGWGMASYPRVFSSLFNSQRSVDGLPVHFNDAHNDWLQAIAEHGIVGAIVLTLTVLVPLIHTGRQISGALPRYLLLGCALLVLYALVEFPFGNFAVVLTWWTLFFAALQYVYLHRPDTPKP